MFKKIFEWLNKKNTKKDKEIAKQVMNELTGRLIDNLRDYNVEDIANSKKKILTASIAYKILRSLVNGSKQDSALGRIRRNIEADRESYVLKNDRFDFVISKYSNFGRDLDKCLLLIDVKVPDKKDALRVSEFNKHLLNQKLSYHVHGPWEDDIKNVFFELEQEALDIENKIWQAKIDTEKKLRLAQLKKQQEREETIEYYKQNYNGKNE